jgi:hypothetical protein
MTWKQKHIENQHFISLYLKEEALTKNLTDRLKLISEIARMHNQNQHIITLSVLKYNTDCDDYKLKFNSLINGKNKD